MATSDLAKIHAVDEVRFKITKTIPSWMLIDAQGRVTTTGWLSGQLSRYIYLTPPADGVQEFDFLARPPDSGSVVLPVLSPINARSELADIDVENYWGSKMPLKGVAVHAVSNSKRVYMMDRSAAAATHSKMVPHSTVAYIGTTDDKETLGYEEDIKPLFRDRDALVMQAVAGFNLHKYADVKKNAAKILEKLKLNMPCDGLWPKEDIGKFETWMNSGMRA